MAWSRSPRYFAAGAVSHSPCAGESCAKGGFGFPAVIHACAESGKGREHTWITADIIAAYIALHKLGFAHSVECWRDGRLVGSLYGVAACGLFAEESIFSRERDASKAVLVHLAERLKQDGFQLLDTQFMTAHLRRFGAVEISRRAYGRRLRAAMEAAALF